MYPIQIFKTAAAYSEAMSSQYAREQLLIHAEWQSKVAEIIKLAGEDEGQRLANIILVHDSSLVSSYRIENINTLGLWLRQGFTFTDCKNWYEIAQKVHAIRRTEQNYAKSKQR